MIRNQIPPFIKTQYAFTAYVRDPQNNPPLPNVPRDRLHVYHDLVYCEMEEFLADGFPVLRSIYNENLWEQMVNDFIARHRSKTPYFRQIWEEFLAYLQHERNCPADPPFLLELAHYEWIEAALDRATDDINWQEIDRKGDLISGIPTVSPLAYLLRYRFPVHRISEDFQPQQVPENLTLIVVYRDPDDTVNFMEVNSVTARLLELLEQNAQLTGLAALQQIASEMQHPRPSLLINEGRELLNHLREHHIITGTKINC